MSYPGSDARPPARRYWHTSEHLHHGARGNGCRREDGATLFLGLSPEGRPCIWAWLPSAFEGVPPYAQLEAGTLAGAMVEVDERFPLPEWARLKYDSEHPELDDDQAAHDEGAR